MVGAQYIFDEWGVDDLFEGNGYITINLPYIRLSLSFRLNSTDIF